MKLRWKKSACNWHVPGHLSGNRSTDDPRKFTKIHNLSRLQI